MLRHHVTETHHTKHPLLRRQPRHPARARRGRAVDLVYLDPPFNSNANYNVLFAEQDGAQAAAQIKAFEDTWTWDDAAAARLRGSRRARRQGRREAMQAFRTFLGDSDMLAYLAMMAPRLVELRRVLKPTGSIYLHCDPTASHYLKMLMDAVFGPRRHSERDRLEADAPPTAMPSKVARSYRRVSRRHLASTTQGIPWTWNPEFIAV